MAALFLVFAGKSSARSAVCGPTTNASIADRPMRMSVIEMIELIPDSVTLCPIS